MPFYSYLDTGGETGCDPLKNKSITALIFLFSFLIIFILLYSEKSISVPVHVPTCSFVSMSYTLFVASSRKYVVPS